MLGGQDLARETFEVRSASGPVGSVRTEAGVRELTLTWTVAEDELKNAQAFHVHCASLTLPASAIYKSTDETGRLNAIEDAVNACSAYALCAGESERRAAEYAARQRTAAEVTLSSVEGLAAANVQEAVAELARREGGGGTGRNGVTFTPAVTNGMLSWTNDGGLENPAPIQIMGPAGPSGRDGADGLTTSVNGIQQIGGNISLAASSIPIASITGMTATNVQEALSENFQSVVNGKQLLETAIFDKGGTVSKVGSVATFVEIKQGIESIETAPTVVENETLPYQAKDLYALNMPENDYPRIKLTWKNPKSPYFNKVKIVRNSLSFPKGIDDGETVYYGNDEVCYDAQNLVNNTRYYYRIFASNLSEQFQTDITGATCDVLTSLLVEVGTTLKAGDKVRFGTFKSSPIVWTIIGMDHPGYPPGSVTLFSDKALDYLYMVKNTGNKWGYGSWMLREWLNNYKKAMKRRDGNYDIPYYNNLPKKEYPTTYGFLDEFTENEQNILMETHIKAGYFAQSSHPDNLFAGAVSEDCWDKMFILSAKELYPVGTKILQVNNISTDLEETQKMVDNNGNILYEFSDGVYFDFFRDNSLANCTQITEYAKETYPYTNVTSLTYFKTFSRSMNSYNIGLESNAMDEILGTVAHPIGSTTYLLSLMSSTEFVRPACNILGKTKCSPTPDEHGVYTLYPDKTDMPTPTKRLRNIYPHSLLKFGSYQGQPIVWVKIEDGHFGYPEGSSTFIAPVICVKPFDTSGCVTYSKSQIRQWLNSDQEAGQWYVGDTPPDYAATEGGFLNGFSEYEKSLIFETEVPTADNAEMIVAKDKCFLISATEVGGYLGFIPKTEGTRFNTMQLQMYRVGSQKWFNETCKIYSRTRYKMEDTVTMGGSPQTYFSFSERAFPTAALGIAPVINLPGDTLCSLDVDEDGCFTLI